MVGIAQTGSGKTLAPPPGFGGDALWMDEILHRFETMGNHSLLVLTGEACFKGLIGGSGFPSTVCFAGRASIYSARESHERLLLCETWCSWSLPSCPVAPFFPFFGEGSPLNLTDQKRMPFFSHGHWASELGIMVERRILKMAIEGGPRLLDCPRNWRVMRATVLREPPVS